MHIKVRVPSVEKNLCQIGVPSQNGHTPILGYVQFEALSQAGV